MITHYKPIVRNSRFSKFGLLFMLSCMAGFVQAQLSGNYTIDATKTTSGSNYASWSAFASAIGTSGVNGPVRVTVITDETTASVVTLMPLQEPPQPTPSPSMEMASAYRRLPPTRLSTSTVPTTSP
jgi:hypothetical protein